MAASKRSFTFRLLEDQYDKIQDIAAYERRSMAAQIEYVIQQCIEEFEKKHGPIKLEK